MVPDGHAACPCTPSASLVRSVHVPGCGCGSWVWTERMAFPCCADRDGLLLVLVVLLSAAAAAAPAAGPLESPLEGTSAPPQRLTMPLVLHYMPVVI
jgi:hypothetical protein